MISAISGWTKSLGLAIIIVSILEMILPNNKLKKYIKVVMGIYVLFTIVEPFIDNKESFAIEDLEFENYVAASTNTVDQTSMDKRIKQLYLEEMEKNIKTKVEAKGYIVNSCKVDANITDELQNTTINKIHISAQKNESKQEESKKENDTLENKVVTSIQSIKKVEVDSKESDDKSAGSLSKSDIKELKQYLAKEYEVSEECLEIN